MVSGRVRAAQLGPVRSGPVLGLGRVEGQIPGEARSGRRRKTGSPSTTCGGRGSAGSRERVLGAQVTGN